MPNYKLTYFDFDGGRAEPLRIVFHAAGMAFEDERLSFQDFGARQSEFPFNCVPVLEVDGQSITQSNSLLRHGGKLAGLYPEDALQALYADEVMDAVEDITHHTTKSFGLKGDVLKEARAKFLEGWLTVYLKGIEKLLTRGGGEYFAGGALSVADLKVFVWMRSLLKGNLDHISPEAVTAIAPALAAHTERIAKEPRIVAYYAR